MADEKDDEKTKGGLTEEQRQKAEKERKESEERLEARSRASEEKTEELAKELAKLRAELKAAQDGKGKKGDQSEIERRMADLEEELKNEKALRIEAQTTAAKTRLDSEVRKALEGKVSQAALDDAVDLLILRGDVRVDKDGKVAARVEKGRDSFGSLKAESLLALVPASMQMPKGVSGAGERGTEEEVTTKSLIEKTIGPNSSQAEFEKAEKDGSLKTTMKQKELARTA